MGCRCSSENNETRIPVRVDTQAWTARLDNPHKLVFFGILGESVISLQKLHNSYIDSNMKS